MASKCARWSVSLLLASVLLICAQESARADATPAEIRQINLIYRLMASVSGMPALQAAIAESDAIGCVNQIPSNANPGDRDVTVRDCIDKSTTPAFSLPVEIMRATVEKSRYILQGAWVTRDTYPGRGTADGTMIVDNNNVGTVNSSRGTSRVAFGKCDPPDCDKTYIVFGYRTPEGDHGNGALQVSPDGCFMYGSFFSQVGNASGTFLAVRC